MSSNETPAVASSTREPAGRRGSWLARGLIVLVVLLCLAVVAMCGINTYGLVIGEEFSPDTFVQRSFWYYELPVVAAQISPVYRTERKSDLVIHLRTKQLLPASERDEPRWHFVEALRGGRQLEGPAKILCTYFEIKQDGQPLWLQWSKDHPKLAAVLWPHVARVARRHQYDFVPDMLQLALVADDPTRFRRDLRRLLARLCTQLGKDHFQVEAYDDAISAHTQALAYDPNHAAALQGRSDAYQAAGELEKAAADRARAAQLNP
jgi:tetratricopeptide (TPR) repeat protein